MTFPQPIIKNPSATVRNISALYVYYQESGQAFNQWQVVGVPPTMASYKITDLEAHTDYEFYMVTAANDGTGAASVKVKFKTVEAGKRRAFTIFC